MDKGASFGPGSRAPHEADGASSPIGFDPSRVDRDWHGNPVDDFAAWVYGQIAELDARHPPQEPSPSPIQSENRR